MNEADRKRFEEVLFRIEKIERYISNISEEEFYNSDLLKDACHANLIVLSEAISKINNEVKARETEINWKEITGFRTLIVHEYFNINWITVWQIIKNDLGDLKNKVQQILNKEN